MTEARRALPVRRHRRGWLLVAVPLVLLVAGTFIVLRFPRQADFGRLPIPAELTTPATPTAADPTPSVEAQEANAVKALKGCRTKVQAADEVMASAKDGMRHWAEHVQAQTDALDGQITVGKMEDIFDRTMKAGDEDEKRYTEAVRTYRDREGSCRPVAGASANVAKQLAQCTKRGRAQRPVLATAEDGMADWTKHLADMRRSMKGKIHNPQKKWLETWKAAPPHINAYEKAAAQFSASEC